MFLVIKISPETTDKSIVFVCTHAHLARRYIRDRMIDDAKAEPDPSRQPEYEIWQHVETMVNQ
jgi:hypothetical protein